MILGLDMGGTHTDAVLIQGKKILHSVKILTRSDLLSSILEAIEKVTEGYDKQTIKRLVLSTTLTTNAIVQNKMSRTGVIIEPGPGLAHDFLKIHDDTYFVDGYIDHRGKVIKNFTRDSIIKIKEELKKKNIQYAGIISKFSTRNNTHEEEIAQLLNDQLVFSSQGHKISGNLNFPRRINTAYLNAAVYEIHKKFVSSVLEVMKKQNITAPVYMLKADGGTILIEESVDVPVQTITSGPAASIMGILGLAMNDECMVALDIGGTTTDIAIIHKGAPLLEPEGITIDKYKTLIRALFTHSIGAGGDSTVKYDNGFIIGPERKDIAFCQGGKYVTPTDAARYLGLSDYGDLELAKKAMLIISEQSGLPPEQAAQAIVNALTEKITTTVQEMLTELNQKPVYTIHELIEGSEIQPTIVSVMGGPASVFGRFIAEALNCKLVIPEHVKVANAIGAGIARTTTEVTVHADTSQGFVKCIEEGVEEPAGKNFGLGDAEKFARSMLLKRVIRQGADERNIEIEITEAQSFNMVRGFYTAGKNIRVKAQVKPGIIKEFKNN